jgi:hypothetical protein
MSGTFSSHRADPASYLPPVPPVESLPAFKAPVGWSTTDGWDTLTKVSADAWRFECAAAHEAGAERVQTLNHAEAQEVLDNHYPENSLEALR